MNQGSPITEHQLYQLWTNLSHDNFGCIELDQKSVKIHLYDHQFVTFNNHSL